MGLFQDLNAECERLLACFRCKIWHIQEESCSYKGRISSVGTKAQICMEMREASWQSHSKVREVVSVGVVVLLLEMLIRTELAE